MVIQRTHAISFKYFVTWMRFGMLAGLPRRLRAERFRRRVLQARVDALWVALDPTCVEAPWELLQHAARRAQCSALRHMLLWRARFLPHRSATQGQHHS